MNGFTFSPALGWIAGGIAASAMVLLALACVIVHRRRAGASDESAWACARRTLLCLTLALMMLTPSAVTTTTSTAVNATDVVVAVDVTGSMAVQDARYGSDQRVSRLEAAKSAVGDLTSSYANSSFAAIRFGASGTLDVPLTPDAQAIDNWASALSVEPTSTSSGSSLDAPIDRLLLTLKSIREQHPSDALILYLITDGEQTSTANRRTFSSLRQYLDDAFTVGVGSTQGGRIPVVADGGASTGDAAGAETWVTDPATGKPGISTMDKANLQAIADELSGSTIVLDERHTLSGSVSSNVSRQWRAGQSPQLRERVTPVVWPLAIVASCLLTWELGAWIASSRRML